MKQFHRPTDEKRMVAVLDEADYDRWLVAPVEETMSFMRRYPAEGLVSMADPRPPVVRKAVSPDKLENGQGNEPEGRRNEPPSSRR